MTDPKTIGIKDMSRALNEILAAQQDIMTFVSHERSRRRRSKAHRAFKKLQKAYQLVREAEKDVNALMLPGSFA